MKIRLAADLQKDSIVDGLGIRTVIWTQGCSHNCPGCHNPQSWDPKSGRDISIDELLKVIDYNDFNVTFSGGDPLFQIEKVTELAQRIKTELGKNIWCYTGFIWENIVDDSQYRPLLETIDVLVDSPFILGLRDTELRFRGSSNQRIIDVKNSLKAGEIKILE